MVEWMFRKRKKESSKRNLKPFQRDYGKNVGPVFTFYTGMIMVILIFILCFVIYNIIYAIRMV